MKKAAEAIRMIKFICFSISAGVIEMAGFALLNELTNWSYWPYKMRKLDDYWMSNGDWWHFDAAFRMVVNDDAPKEAKESYANWRNQIDSNDRRSQF